MTLVGYTPERFTIRNSWADDRLGDGGFSFGYASYAYLGAAFSEGYGVSA